jgi:Family of unknown function (DUF5330)
MGFLIRAAFWFSLVLLIMPFGGSDKDGETASPFQAFFAAREAVSDVTGICERKPDVCEISKSAFQTIGVRARESARIAYELLDGQFGKPDPSIRTGSVPSAEAAAAAVN